MESNKIIFATGILSVLVFLNLFGTACALKDPAAVYCEQLGYEYFIEKTEIGEMGHCRFSPVEECLGWDFLKGNCGQTHSYCAKAGFNYRKSVSAEECSSIPLVKECLVCVSEGAGGLTTAPQMMELDLRETICGNKLCETWENEKNCPIDCVKKIETTECQDPEDCNEKQGFFQRIINFFKNLF